MTRAAQTLVDLVLTPRARVACVTLTAEGAGGVYTPPCKHSGYKQINK